ncbi:MAG: lactonase family protein [Candidatus Promineifilaceae bacterium]|nr:lactonase family protein [Candidatus Promineifilaceae bacterium]
MVVTTTGKRAGRQPSINKRPADMNRPRPAGADDSLFVYVGTYTDGDSQGIYVCQLDAATGELTQTGVAGGVDNPSYLAIDAERRRLFAVNELVSSGQHAGGRVSAFAIDPVSGRLALLNQQASGGGAPCYLTVARSGRYILVANYVGGTVAVLPVATDGSLGEATAVVVHSGSGPHPQRQEGPHPHAIVLDPADNYALVPDLGLDKVMQYRLDQATGKLRANREPWVAAEPGSGPRHLVFHPTLETAYVINELSSTVTVYRYDVQRGALDPAQTLATLPEDFTGANIAADLHLAPGGRFLYGSNRGHDSIVRYAVDPVTGTLTYLDCTPTGGQRPRGFAIHPGGAFMLVANQDSDNIVTFRLDPTRGTLSPTGHVLAIPSPVCLKFLASSG